MLKMDLGFGRSSPKPFVVMELGLLLMFHFGPAFIWTGVVMKVSFSFQNLKQQDQNMCTIKIQIFEMCCGSDMKFKLKSGFCGELKM